MKEPIKVFLRLRPLNEGEEKEGGEKSVKAIGQKKITVDRAQGDSLEAEFDSVSKSRT